MDNNQDSIDNLTHRFVSKYIGVNTLSVPSGFNGVMDFFYTTRDAYENIFYPINGGMN